MVPSGEELRTRWPWFGSHKWTNVAYHLAPVHWPPVDIVAVDAAAAAAVDSGVVSNGSVIVAGGTAP